MRSPYTQGAIMLGKISRIVGFTVATALFLVVAFNVCRTLFTLVIAFTA